MWLFANDLANQVPPWGGLYCQWSDWMYPATTCRSRVWKPSHDLVSFGNVPNSWCEYRNDNRHMYRQLIQDLHGFASFGMWISLMTHSFIAECLISTASREVSGKTSCWWIWMWTRDQGQTVVTCIRELLCCAPATVMLQIIVFI